MKNSNLLDANVNKDQKTALRNYFIQQAVLSRCIGGHLLPSLKGIKIVGSDIPGVRT
jgi:hypothetical protein